MVAERGRRLLQNPTYAGVHAYDRSKTRVRIEEERKRMVRTLHRKGENWSVMIIDATRVTSTGMHIVATRS